MIVQAAPGPGIPPPTPVPPDGRLSPFPTALATPRNAVTRPDVSAAGAVLADLDSGSVLFQQAPEAPRPIASLTKIMTALVVLERRAPDDIVIVDERAVFGGGDYGATSSLGLRAGERIRVDDLLYALMLGSANDAAEALAIDIAGSVPAFVEAMNRRAGELGMQDTTFASPHGLNDRGRSTPRDLLRLIRAAYAIPRFARITQTKFHTIPEPGGGKDRRIQNRNALLWLYPGAFGTKTGFTFRAGPCLVATAERDGRRLVAIVLRADREAFSQAATLLNYGFEGFAEHTFVVAGQDEGTVDIRGGTVPVVAGRGLDALIPTRVVDDVIRTVDVDPKAAYPPALGQGVGTLTFTVPGRAIGSVPLVVSSVAPPEPEAGSWWARTVLTVADGVADVIWAFAD